MAGSRNKIALSPSTAPMVVIEAPASGAITPGHLLERTTTSLKVHATSGGAAQRIFALENIPNSGTVDDAYANADTVRAGIFREGDHVYALVAIGTAAIALNAALESAGDGTVKTQTAAVAASVFIDGAAADGGVTYTSLIAGTHGNDLQIIQNDAGSAAVSISGLTITVTPGSGANTAGDVVAQIVADVAASNLVTATAEGDGTGEPGTSAGVTLASGVAAGANVLAYAREAVDNSGGSAIARIEIEVHNG